MNIKDKIIFGLLAVLLVSAGYFQYISDVMQSRMVVLNEQDKRHIDIVDKEFREDLRKLDLKFEGRGKHLRKAQADILANTKLIYDTADSLSDAIDDVQWNLDEHARYSDRKFQDVEEAHRDLEDSFDSYRRRNDRKYADLEQTIQAIQNDVTKLNEKVFEEEKGKKK